MKKDIDFLKLEEQGMNERLGDKEVPLEHDETIFEKIFKRFDAMSEHMKNYKPPINKVEFPQEMTVKGSVTVKEAIEAIVKFPLVQKITGRVTADVEFPDVQKVEGTVKAEVEFPKEFEVTVKNQQQFPNIPEIDLAPLLKSLERMPVGIGKAPNKKNNDPTVYVPVRLTDGEAFYSAMNEVAGVMRSQKTLLEPKTPLFYSGQKKITASGSAVALPPADTSSVLVQALRDNVALIYVTANNTPDFELQAGQAVSIDIDRSEKVKIIGSIANDGVSFIFS